MESVQAWGTQNGRAPEGHYCIVFERIASGCREVTRSQSKGFQRQLGSIQTCFVPEQVFHGTTHLQLTRTQDLV
eukprot:2969377-Amphidinium_carterae.1